MPLVVYGVLLIAVQSVGAICCWSWGIWFEMPEFDLKFFLCTNDVKSGKRVFRYANSAVERGSAHLCCRTSSERGNVRWLFALSLSLFSISSRGVCVCLVGLLECLSSI